MRRNLIGKLEAGETLFPGILGYDESVVPQVANAILSRHNMILLGLRGQAVHSSDEHLHATHHGPHGPRAAAR